MSANSWAGNKKIHFLLRFARNDRGEFRVGKNNTFALLRFSSCTKRLLPILLHH